VLIEGRRDSSVGIATGYGQEGRGLIPGSGKNLSSLQRPDRPCGPPSLLSSGFEGVSPGDKEAGA
jgi:hypothetical protein